MAFNITENICVLLKKRSHLHVGLKTNTNQHDMQKQTHAMLYANVS